MNFSLLEILITLANQNFFGVERFVQKPNFARSVLVEDHFSNLRKQVNSRLEKLPKSRRLFPVIKAILLPILFISLYAIAIKQIAFVPFLLAYLCMGLMVVLLFVNLIHDACHYTLFPWPKVNKAYMRLFDMLGANSYIWRKRHVRLHHNYPNIVGWDSDIEKSDYLKVHPGDEKRKGGKHQKWMIFLYPLFVLNWFLIRDFRDYFTRNTIAGKLGRIPRREYITLFIFKYFFLGYMVAIPAWVTPFSLGEVVLAWFFFMVAAGLFGLIVLLPPHANIFNEFPLMDDKGKLTYSWLHHQLLTTNDVTMDNWLSRHLMANFNYHIIHHLFPHLPHVYAKEATEVLKQYCHTHQLPYRSLPLFKAIWGHFQLIVSHKTSFNLFEEDM